MSDDQKDAPQLPACYDCATNADDRLEQMFVEIVQKRRIALGQNPAMRPVFRKTHGVAAARFVVRDDLADDLKIGIFAGREYAVWLRSSSDTSPTSPDLTTTVGIALKLFGVPGPKLIGDGDTADFILQNSDVFFVDTAKDMCEFTYAGVVQGDYQPYLDAHPTTDSILKQMARVEGSVLTTTYWSGLPFRFGADQYVKYKLEPETAPANIPDDATDYLATDLANRLRAREYRFRFMAQFRRGDMPLDAATVAWSEAESPPVQLATLIIPAQEVNGLGQEAYGDNLSFNIWRVPAEHEPVGSLAQARRQVYSASADTRRSANGTSLDEPAAPRPPPKTPPTAPPPRAARKTQAPATKAGPGDAAAAPADTCVVKAAIYPGIGVARVGNSPDEFFLAPDVPDPEPLPPGSHRDAQGRLKRQGVTFRVYGLNATGQIVKELTAAEGATIHWTAHLVNQKSAWYQFQLALDIPEADSVPPTLLRNSTVADRGRLIIDPGPRTIAGVAGAPVEAFDTGEFMEANVYLGELRTDAQGHLIVLGGHGVSSSYDGSVAVTFANNEGWHDDTADGPVTATVEYQGLSLEVAPAWVVVAPPNYAPMQKSVRTMWDLMRDVAITAGLLPRPPRPSFQRDLRPIFERLSRLQWVNAGFAAAFGWKGPFELSTPAWLARLNSPSPAERELRLTIANQFREFQRDAWSPIPWPWLYGDAMAVPAAETPRQNAVLTDTQLMFLKQWAAGDFEADYDPAYVPPRTLDQVPLPQRGDTLDQASLELCLADAFHPGCEMTWPVRTASMYLAPFRWKHGAGQEAQYGASMTSDTLTLPNGPLAGQYPGSITRWMAVPWQTDTASCRSGYQKSFDPYLPTFWPARVPNQVLTKQNYDVVMNTTLPLDERLKAFANRAAWTRPIDRPVYTDTINTFIAHIDWVGVVEPWPGPPAEADGSRPFPAELEVEDHAHTEEETEALAATGEAARVTDRKPRLAASGRTSTGAATTHPTSQHATEALERQLGTIEKARRFPHGLRRR
jgi:L-Lysine epsilon oxidase N-terminal/L-lysine epsilon oxidase C-terminal domain